MLRLWASIKKECLLLVRDRAGLAVLFLMPMGLILVMTLIQDVSFRKLNEKGLPILFLDEDRDALGGAIRKGLEGSGFFQIVTTLDPSGLTKEKVLKEIARGKYQIGIVIPKGTSEMIRTWAKGLVQKTLSEGDSSKSLAIPKKKEGSKIILVFDPVIKSSFKQSIRNALENFTSRIETKIAFQVFSSEIAALMPKNRKPILEPENLVQIEEIYAANPTNEIVPNSVQHNVPAWTIFAMFFIVIPLTGNLIKEREGGTALRLRVMPGSYVQVLSSKIVVYLAVCLTQFFLMMLVGIAILPLFGLPALDPGHQKPALLILALSTALAATGYGVLLGTVATTHEQAASFGSVSVVILAAIGGIWVPVFIMPAFMQKLSRLSPLNWGMEGFYDVFLRGSGIGEILPNVGLLLGFFLVMLSAALFYNKIKRVG
ncbi:MAG: ABC transporter permease [Desulfobacca sp.]|nr:ABC transporter permease [Desulfobacca sp.]